MKEELKQEFIRDAKKRLPKEMRLGQFIFYACCRLYPERTEKARGSGKDCFYADSKIDEFLDFVMEEPITYYEAIHDDLNNINKGEE